MCKPKKETSETLMLNKGFPIKQNKTKQQILSVLNSSVNDKVNHFWHSLQLPNPPQLYEVKLKRTMKIMKTNYSVEVHHLICSKNHDIQFESLITNDLLANNSKAVEIPTQDNFILINVSRQQKEKMKISENTEVIIIPGQNIDNSSPVLSTNYKGGLAPNRPAILKKKLDPSASERYRNELMKHSDNDLEVLMIEWGPEHGDQMDDMDESCSD
ncbi:hypothetical protein AGLY_013963 [Aphis glycines]|uniref:Uncharacterized protein n=1 Tax=Aphis glycines TaxID=307491 RepID=A0A6G0T4P4_APHGL|nr:hypothetical protein AGLY_013963 [Aphis glycines]